MTPRERATRWAYHRRDLLVPVAIGVFALALIGLLLLLVRIEVGVAVAIIAAAATVLASSVSVTVTRYLEKLRELEQHRRERKTPVYERFVGFWFDYLYAEKLGKKQPTTQAVIAAFLEWTKLLTIWGSDDVIREWARFRERMEALEDAPAEERQEILADFERVLLAIRRDVGYPDTGLSRGDLLALWLTVDALRELRKRPPRSAAKETTA